MYWTLGLENQIKADSKIDFVGPYKPTTFKNRGGKRGKAIDVCKVGQPHPCQAKSRKEQLQSKETPTKEPVFLELKFPETIKILTLNEVEIFSGGKNVARQGKAKQSSVGSGGVPERAIDGNKNPDWGGGGQTHTDGFGTTNPWWEVDLGKEFVVDKVEVWNRKDFEKRLDGFTLQLLDSNRKQLYKSGKTKGAQRIKFTLKSRTIIDFMLYNGQPEPKACGFIRYHQQKFPVDTGTNFPSLLKKATPWRSSVTDWPTGCSTMHGWKLSYKVP